MSDVKWLRPTPPPELPGHYIIRSPDKDIIYWGDSVNLYCTWKEKVCKCANVENTFEYTVADSTDCGLCHMSDIY